MITLLWIAVAVVVANAIFGAVLLVRFRAEGKRAAEARHRLPDPAVWKVSAGGSSPRHLT